MLDLKLLTTFREVAVRRSFSDAAAVLSFTQPAVSQHIGRLEDALGTRLLERDARGVSLTPSGETLLRHASLPLEDPGLTVFPPHRLISGLVDAPDKQEALGAGLKDLFEVEEVPTDRLDPV